jgi:hypothetical protein
MPTYAPPPLWGLKLIGALYVCENYNIFGKFLVCTEKFLRPFPPPAPARQQF